MAWTVALVACRARSVVVPGWSCIQTSLLTGEHLGLEDLKRSCRLQHRSRLSSRRVGASSDCRCTAWIVLLDKTLIHHLVLFIALWSCTETVILTFNHLESIETNYVETNYCWYKKSITWEQINGLLYRLIYMMMIRFNSKRLWPMFQCAKWFAQFVQNVH